MKRILFAIGILLSTSSYCQNCLGYYLLQNNRTIDNTIYNKNGEVYGKQVYSVSGVSSAGNITTANIKLQMFDSKGKMMANSTNNIKCKGGVIMMNMKMMMAQEQQFADAANAKGESAFIEYPSAMKVGDNLKNATFAMDMNRGGMQQHVSVKITNRKVEGKQKITTPAGSWDCFKISYKGKIVVNAMGMEIPLDLNGTEWFSAGFGIIKTKSNLGGTEITRIGK
ncbi:MAG: hypothetical protein WKF91_01990 [Segetibacter sp.]